MWLAIAWLTTAPDAPQVDPELTRVWLPVIGLAGLLAGLAMALWLDHALVGAVRGYLVALRAGQVTELRDLPAASGWGELSALGEETQRVLLRQQRMGRAFEELNRLQDQLEASRDALDRWLRAEQWTPLPEQRGPFGVVANLLNEGLTRHDELREQGREAARQIQQDLDRSLEDARVSAEQTERGFVEATSLLTTVRELQRLSLEVARSAAPAPAPEGAESFEALRAAAARALAELVQASGDSIRHLSAGLLRVHDVGEHVQALGNRATLMALNVMVARGRPGTSSEAELEELRSLGREVRASTDRVAEIAREVEAEVARAGERMKGVRESVAAALDRIPAPAPRAASVHPDFAHVLERMREMIQDATAKGERLSSAGERASRAAERLVRHLEESTAELEGLVIRLSPAAEHAEDATGSGGGPEGGAASGEAPDAGPESEAGEPEPEDPMLRRLRLLGRDDMEPGPPGRSNREGRP